MKKISPNIQEQDPDWLPRRGPRSKKKTWKATLVCKNESNVVRSQLARRLFDPNTLFSTITLGRYRTRRDLLRALETWRAGRGIAGRLWGPANYNVVVTFKGEPVEIIRR